MKKTAHGFTLIELLVVVAIIAILAVVVALIINPPEMISRTRDADRVTDVASIKQAIDIAQSEATDSGAAVLCNGGSYPCTGSSNSGARTVDGNGWVKVNVSGIKGIDLPTLPIDPINNSNFHYTYCADKDAYEINTKLESVQQKSRMKNDGGDDDNLFESGTSLTLISPSGGSCTY